jgi:hypothetical protein
LKIPLRPLQVKKKDYTTKDDGFHKKHSSYIRFKYILPLRFSATFASLLHRFTFFIALYSQEMSEPGA